MARFGGGFPGMGGANMNQLLRQAQKMQADMEKTQADIEAKEFDITTGGGAVTIRMNGKKKVKSIKINPEVVEKEDVEMLEDLLLTALNEGFQKAEDLVEAEMRRYNVPGGLSGLL